LIRSTKTPEVKDFFSAAIRCARRPTSVSPARSARDSLRMSAPHDTRVARVGVKEVLPDEGGAMLDGAVIAASCPGVASPRITLQSADSRQVDVRLSRRVEKCRQPASVPPPTPTSHLESACVPGLDELLPAPEFQTGESEVSWARPCPFAEAPPRLTAHRMVAALSPTGRRLARTWPEARGPMDTCEPGRYDGRKPARSDRPPQPAVAAPAKPAEMTSAAVGYASSCPRSDEGSRQPPKSSFETKPRLRATGARTSRRR
jgi:hypothetical protein